ncbi:hypothetical protein BH09ACT7_BH09ACT7_00400 [soil metagenome]
MTTPAPHSAPASARRRWPAVVLSVVVAVSLVVAVGVLNRARISFQEQAARSLAVGDCVVVPSSAPNLVRATKSSCVVDPSYTIGATTTASGTCPSAEYQRFPAPAADESTATLCLVPNLVADHCYQLEMPIGIVARADCAASRTDPTGVLVQVTERLDVRDQTACPTANGHYAWPYPAPARTYCTQTLF